MIPEIDIWRVANLMLKRYGDEADIESAIRAEELAEEGAAGHRCNRAAREYDPSGAAALTAPRREGAAKASPYPRAKITAPM